MKKILIIEDELSIAELERDYLEINGYAVDMEHRGDAGLQKALAGSYDLIILDLMLAAGGRLRNLPAHPQREGYTDSDGIGEERRHR
ncbi:hypothetical protein LJK87_14960 [Paenibacillus sp. P25]|nr:hypothetical protein LJK87_14960 [Paenibacillus sp. P25]